MGSYKEKSGCEKENTKESDLREQIERADRQIDQMLERFAQMQRGYERRKVGKSKPSKPHLQLLDGQDLTE